MKKIYYILLICLFAVSGCAKKEQGGRVVIRLANAENLPDQVKVMEEIANEFEKRNPDIKINLAWGVKKDKILTEISAGDPPDVFMWWQGLEDLRSRDALLPMNEYIKKYNVNLKRYFPALVETYTFGEKLFGLPLQMKTSCLAYNKDLFDAAKLPYPDKTWTWDKYLEIASKLTIDKDGDGRRDQFGTVLPWFIYWIAINGGDVVDTKTMKCVIDRPKSREALEFLYKLYKNACPAFSNQETSGASGSEMESFLTGRTAMYVVPAWALGSCIKGMKNHRWALAPVPKPSKGKMTGIFDDACLVIANKTKHPEEAFRFINFYCGPEGMKIFARGRNGIPADREAANTVFAVPPPEGLKYYVDAAESSTKPLIPRVKNFLQIQSICQWSWDSILMGSKDIDTALSDCVKDVNKVLAESNVK